MPNHNTIINPSTIDSEEWRPIGGFEGRYEVSNLGRVRSVDQLVGGRLPGFLREWKGRVLKQTTMPAGYRMVSLGGEKNVLVHRLVAKAFISNPDNKPHVNHLNGVKSANGITNLAWCTPSENERHSYDVLGKQSNMAGLEKGHQLARDTLSKVVYQYSLDGLLLRQHASTSDAARFLRKNGLPKANQSCISVCCRGEGMYAYGFIWLYDLSELARHLQALPRLRQWLLRDSRRGWQK